MPLSLNTWSQRLLQSHGSASVRPNAE